mmetsp:Transcript_11249/g.32345  ORF Transcript_11249/g.32345 Transcript_11249/m.32345 type:complete len:417 (-) Transcript_11249:1827-3077(-)
MGAVGGPAAGRRSSGNWHLESIIVTEVSKSSHLVDFFGILGCSKVVAEIAQVVIPRIVISKVEIVGCCGDSTWTGTGITKVVTFIPRINAAANIGSGCGLLGLLFRFGCGQILQGGLLHFERWPVVGPEDGRWWLQETPAAPVGCTNGLVNTLGQRFDIALVGLDGNLDSICVIGETVNAGADECEREIPAGLEDRNAFGGISQQQRVVVPSHDVPAHVGDLEHLAELLGVTRDQVQEGETIKVLGALVTHLNDLVVALAKGLAAELAPNVTFRFGLLLQGEGRFHGSLDVATSQGKAESSLWIADEVKGNFRESLGLQVRNDGTTAELAVLDHVHDLAVLLVRQRQREPCFGGINADDASTSLAIQAKELVLDGTHGIQRRIQRADGSSVSGWQAVLDMVQGGVDEEFGAGASGR